MRLVERHIIKDNRFEDVCLKSGLLYNYVLFNVRQGIFSGDYINEYEFSTKLCKENQVDFRNLPSVVSQQVVAQVFSVTKSWMKSKKEYEKNPSKFLSRPKLPKYKKGKKQNMVVFTKNSCRLKEDGCIHFIKNIIRPIKTKIGDNKLCQVRIIPQATCYVVEVIYEKKEQDLNLDKDNFMIVSPDEGAINRNMYYASVLGVDLGMFYKRRDYSRVVNGRNPIVAHEYLGNSVEGKDVFIADDIISSGESMLDIAYELKKRKANRIFTYATYSIFTNGLDEFDKAYNDGIIDGVFGTNLTYRSDELKKREWFYEVDVSKYIAYFIAAINHDVSISTIIDPHEKIKALLEKHKSV